MLAIARTCDGSLQCVKVLIKSPGININCQDDDGNTILHLAGRYSILCLKLIINTSQTKDLNEVKNKKGLTPIEAYENLGYNKSASILKSLKNAEQLLEDI